MFNTFQFIKNNYFWVFILFTNFYSSQIIIRNSDYKAFDSINLIHKNQEIILSKSNFKKYVYDVDDKVKYMNKLLDFYISGDSLIFFDKVKEIEGIDLVKENYDNKKEKTFNNSKGRGFADVFSNQRIATYVNINTDKKTFLKSITVFPEPKLFSKNIKGFIIIDILSNIDGKPNENLPILSFQKNISDSFQKKWEIRLPKIIRFPEEGIYISFLYKSDDKRSVVLRLNSDSKMYMYYPQTKEWKELNHHGYQFKLKVLQ